MTSFPAKVLALKVGTAATNATASVVIDRTGFDYLTLNVAQAAASATDSADKFQVLKLAEGDTSNVSSSSDIAAFVGSTATSVTSGFVIAAHNNTSNPGVHRFGLDLRARKKYIFAVYQPDAQASTIYIHGELSRGKQSPDSTTDLNVNAFVQG